MVKLFDYSWYTYFKLKKNIHLLCNNMQNYFTVVDVHSLSITLTLQVLKIMTPMVLVFNRIKIVVGKDYHIDWSVRPEYTRSARCIIKSQMYSIDINRSFTPICMITLQSLYRVQINISR